MRVYMYSDVHTYVIRCVFDYLCRCSATMSIEDRSAMVEEMRRAVADMASQNDWLEGQMASPAGGQAAPRLQPPRSPLSPQEQSPQARGAVSSPVPSSLASSRTPIVSPNDPHRRLASPIVDVARRKFLRSISNVRLHAAAGVTPCMPALTAPCCVQEAKKRMAPPIPKQKSPAADAKPPGPAAPAARRTRPIPRRTSPAAKPTGAPGKTAPLAWTSAALRAIVPPKLPCVHHLGRAGTLAARCRGRCH
jgi:hypothetical protein